MKQFFNNKKVLLASLLCLIVVLGTIGIASGEAQASLEDLIYNRVYGTFAPSEFYTDDADDVKNWEVVGSLQTSDIIVDYSAWYDYNQDGFVDLHDVYAQEDYQFKFLMNTHTLPIIDTGKGDYYIVKLSHFSQVDQVLASIYIALNTDQSQMKDISNYYYDRDTHILYLSPSLMYDIDNDVELKAQSVSIVHNIDEFTKEFAIATVVNPDLGKTPLEGTLPNGIQRRSYKRWIMDGLDIPLVSPEHLAYVKEKDIRIYVNQELYSNWQYDATTGIISLPDATPDDVNNVAIYIEDLHAPSAQDTFLQYAQNQWGKTAQAITFADLPENRLCQHITYTTAPQVGRREALDFYAFVYQEVAKTATSLNLNNLKVTGLTVFENALGAVSNEDILRAINSVYKNSSLTIDPTTGSTSLANDVLSLWTPFDANATDTGDLFFKMMDLNQNYAVFNGQDTYYLDAVYNKLQGLSIYAPGNDGQLLRSWQYWKEGSKYTDAQTAVGMYVVGKSNSTNQLLGGVVDKGFPYFTVTSCNIQIPANPERYNPIPTVSQYDSHQTVISIIGKTDKYLYLSIAPLTLQEEDSFAYERLCGFTKVRYTYVGRGNITFIKTDVHKAWLGGAEYEIYKANKVGGTISNATLVDYYDYFNDTDYVPKEDATPQGNTIVTSSTAAVKISLPYIYGNETYFFLEKTPPVGYLRDDVKWFFTVNENQVEATITAMDLKQDGVITWTVYDATTRSTPESPRVQVPLNDIPFTLVDESGQPAICYNKQDNFVRDYSTTVTGQDGAGTIVFRVRPGTYYVRQLDTIENYYMDIHDIDSIEVPFDENCNYFKIVVEADRSGEDIALSFSHFEKRQEVRIQSQVYDERIGNKTPPHLGGTGAGEVETVNSEWELHVLGSEDLLVGYKTDGTEVKINNSSGALTVDSIYEPRTANSTVYAYAGGKANNPGTSDKLTYISATHIWINNIRYPLPNGTYCWKLKQASKGYVTTENRKTDLDAKWIEENKQEALKIVMDTADESILSYVVMDRQQTNTFIYSKAYDKTVAAGAFNYSDVAPRYNSYAWNDTIRVFDKINYTIVTNSTHAQIQPASIEKIQYTGDNTAEVYAKKFSVYNSTQTNGTANLINGLRPHAIYQLQNITDIVALNGGVIPANTILGRYMSDNDGYIFIDSFGSEVIVNPNVTAQDRNASFERVGVVDVLGRDVNGTELPNGDYILSVMSVPDEHEIEEMFEFTPIYHTWTKTDSKLDILDRTRTIPFYHARNTIGPNGLDNAGTYLAPSPIDETPADPYEPREPDEPAVSPDDSDDIPCPTDLAWIIKHRNDRTYRTIDRDNFAETQDIVPTTMAMAYTDSTITEWESKYALYMFYEITADEYNAARAAYEAAGFSSNEWERNWEYRRQSFGGEVLYFRRFAVTATPGSTILTQNMAFNKTTEAWLSYDELTRNKTMSAAIDNTSWINMKMAAPEFQGAYHIGFGVLTIREKRDPLSDITLRKEEFSDSLAIMCIRNRQLFNLD